MSRMLALVKEKPVISESWPEGFRLEERPVPEISRPDQVKVEVLMAGICGTDVGIYHSKSTIKAEMTAMGGKSVITGHEFCGVVTDAGQMARETLARSFLEKSLNDPEPELQRFIGERTFHQIAADPQFLDVLKEYFYITAEMHIVCGVCYQCRTGNGHACQNTRIKGIHEDGVFARYTIIPVNNALLIKKGEIPPEVIAFMDAFGNALHTTSSVDLQGASVAILGSGVQGLMATAIAKRGGASLIINTDVSNPAGGVTQEKLKKNRFSIAYRVGARYAFDMALSDSRKKLIETVMRETQNTGVDAVFEMSGSPGAYYDALDILRMGGTFALLGIPAGDITLDFSNKIIFRGLNIKGIIGRKMFGTWETMYRLLKDGMAAQMMENGYVSHKFPLNEFEKGFEAHERGEAIKVILIPE
ncbi:MAG: alcohol dehydrogenase catalytic domain-containing protein [Calditrichia bacterium]